MFAPFIIALRAAGVPASITEYLALLRALKAGVAGLMWRISTICRALRW